MHSLDSIILDNNKVWAATSNNAIFIEDTARRFVYINLDKPKSKDDKTYSKENLLDWCLDNAGDLAWAVRTIIRGWVVAGRPKWRSLRPADAVPDGAPASGMPSYETWASVMGGVMDWLGIEGFLTNYRRPRQPLMSMALTTTNSSLPWLRSLRTSRSSLGNAVNYWNTTRSTVLLTGWAISSRFRPERPYNTATSRCRCPNGSTLTGIRRDSAYDSCRQPRDPVLPGASRYQMRVWIISWGSTLAATETWMVYW